MLNLEDIKKDLRVKKCILRSDKYLNNLGFTDHGFRHLDLVSERARFLAKNLNFSLKEEELCAMAAYCHDMGNFLGREQHCYSGAMLFSQFFMDDFVDPDDCLDIVQAIVNHDEYSFKTMTKIGAVLILADKTDVHRDRVVRKNRLLTKKDLYDRVNYSVIKSDLKIDKKKKKIILKLKIDTKINGILEYFEAFSQRSTLCQQAAIYLGYKFVLDINNFKLE